MNRSGLTPISTPLVTDKQRVHDLEESMRFLRRLAYQADEGLVTPLELQSFLFAETTRAIGDGPPR